MKTMFISLTMFLFFVGCQNEQNINPDPEPTSLPNLTLGATLQLLPNTLLKGGNAAIFVNESGQELRFSLTYERGTKQKTFEGITYQAEFVYVNYDEDKVGSHFYPSIRIDENYDEYDSSEEVLSAFIMTSYNGGFLPSVTMIDKTTPMFWKYIESVTIANHIFNKVYTNMVSPPEFDSFTIIYYTVEQGIVGFEGEQREMWALDRIE